MTKKRRRWGALSSAESARRAAVTQQRKEMEWWMFRAFTDDRMNENASLIVWTKGQMRGVRATIKRLGLGKDDGDLS